ncbi:hypothetical protein EDB82DRAFT_200639 [Fusarium venenatum]|uniref:uncharacterized protein n=1 Tax=Fusarium venenatum TaxID=56646 RepID=UPI001D1D289F|nr:hypothetical protein EDB82DRAFT_200639 [Fusarium venenatum]
MGLTGKMKHQHDAKQKAKARKSGPSVLRKTQLLGKKGNVLSLALYEEPTHHEYRIAAHIPKGKSIPNLNEILANYLDGRSTPIEPSSSLKSRRRTRSSCRRTAHSSFSEDSGSESGNKEQNGSPEGVRIEEVQGSCQSSSAASEVILSASVAPTLLPDTVLSQDSALSTPAIVNAKMIS